MQIEAPAALRLPTRMKIARLGTRAGPHAIVRLLARVMGIGIETTDMLARDRSFGGFVRPLDDAQLRRQT
jgi:hypothetical protein